MDKVELRVIISMAKVSLFVCQSCRQSSAKQYADQPTDGTQLLDQLNLISIEKIQSNNLEVKPVSCLWVCDRPCAVAFSAPTKPTYLFTTLPTDETAPALLQFSHLYLNSTTGDIPWKQFPAVLQSTNIAKIPPAE
ncbi:DUF1636 domain-containing protein [Leptolyngbya sp. CCNP1308]|uniref:DUF1636 domain-containing protein n=1 Tax=Leptolyngbya sp. CCNP1308 TaxID=3110255 RepID=UPI002B209F3E|nr:DUF1636 domain-containing protein [Leptolyngbya sp. CCNP1308]MEA5451757.1 DUF1636 domain-containing protein [Leptolyngbya sp. CCNP1308]